jgi:hypothetical protein
MGLVAAGTGVAFGSAIALLALFFRTRNERFDRVAEWLFVAFGVLAVPTILAVSSRMAGPEPAWTVLAAVGAIGAGVLALAELASALKLIDFRRIAGLTTMATLAFFVWIGGISAVIVTSSGSPFPATLGWLGIASMVLSIAIIAWITRMPGVVSGDTQPDSRALSFFLLPLVGIVAWLIWLGLSL